MKKGKPVLWLCLFLVVMVLAAVVFLAGIPLSQVAGVYDIEPTHQLISYGLDLTGGVFVVLEADETQTAVTDETLDKAIATIRNRIDSMGLKEPTITKQGSNQIRISIPDIKNQQEALDTIGKTALLEFVSPEGDILLTGATVVNATYQAYEENGLPVHSVSLEFDADGRTAFADATEKYIGQAIAIKLDNETISNPVVQNKISDGNAQITGITSREEGVQLAQLIRAGALPVNFTPVQVQTIGPTLGQDSLQKSLVAGAIGIAAVIVFMVVFYRLPGFAAALGLVVYILLFLNIMAAFRVTLTLPGIAGIILSIGMAVDANVIIFERIKEDLSSGKTVRSSIESGFHRALTSIIDSNVTTVIAGSALFFFGSGTIRGFAVTLIIGVVVSMLTAVTLSRMLINLIVDALKLETPAVFGVKEVGAI
jgi:preprotein translocase subunit SecD